MKGAAEWDIWPPLEMGRAAALDAVWDAYSVTIAMICAAACSLDPGLKMQLGAAGRRPRGTDRLPDLYGFDVPLRGRFFGRLRSVDRSLARGGSDDGLLGKMEYRNRYSGSAPASVYMRCIKSHFSPKSIL
ncbi:hypothetical protein ACLOJK_037149 [Asimina triloba]